MGIIEEGKRYTKDIIIPYYEGDIHNNVKLSSLLQYAQQVSMEHCGWLGIGSPTMNALGKVFLLVKVSVEIERIPRVGEKLKLITAPSLPKRAQYKRVTECFDEQGERVITMDSRWVLVDQTTHRIERNLVPEIKLPLVDASETLEHDLSIPKVKEWEPQRSIRVEYSLMDTNGHINNAQYANIICDTIPLDILKGAIPEKLVIDYRREARGGQTLEVFSKELEDHRFYVAGKVQGEMCFQSVLKLRR